MVTYIFRPQAAIDTSGNLVTSGTGQVYAAASGGSPLTVRDPASDVNMTSIPVSGIGQTAAFKVDDLPEVWWRSGGLVVHLASVTGMREVAEAAADSALGSQAAAEAALSETVTLAATAVKSVNGILPDVAGNVTVSTGGSGGSGGAVTSVAGRTGAVSLTKADVGLAAVDNTADVDKPVSTPQASALAGKANTSHTHTIANVTSLQTALDSKAGVNAAVNASQLNAGTGTVTPARLGTGTPSGSNFLRGDGAWAVPPGGGGGGAVDSVNGQTGEVVLDAADVGALADSTVYVASVAGRTGTVTLAKADVGLANVDNTSDANKPVSTAQATAINAKAADSAVVHNSGNETVAGVKTFSSAPVVPDASFAIAKVNGLQTALNAKMAAGTGITAMVKATQAEYDALGTPGATTLYVIVG